MPMAAAAAPAAQAAPTEDAQEVGGVSLIWTVV